MRVAVIPIVVGALGTPQSLEVRLGRTENQKKRIKNHSMTELFRSGKIFRRV